MSLFDLANVDLIVRATSFSFRVDNEFTRKILFAAITISAIIAAGEIDNVICFHDINLNPVMFAWQSK